MTAIAPSNIVRVQVRPSKVCGRSRARASLLTVALILCAAALGAFFEWSSGTLGLFAARPVIEDRPTGRVIKVPPGGNLQAAIDQATSGDIVELQAGATYKGQIDLPKKDLADFVTIRSSAYADLAEGKRVSPAEKGRMATIVAGMAGRAAIKAADGAHHYRFVGMEFTADSMTFNYGIVVLGNEEKRPERVPHDIEIDRSYIHPAGKSISRRGIALNSASTTIKNSYIAGFGFAGEETQGICGWTGSHNVKIINNYIEAGAENIMFGGSDPANAELIPSDIEVRQNTLSKPRSWKDTATVKTLFELKNAKNVTFAGNYLENNWKGSAFRITVRNQDGGAPFSTIEDVIIRDNIIKGAGEGINILGTDDEHPSQMLKRLTITNNLLLDLVGNSGDYEGSGYFVQVCDGEGISITNNTVMNRGNIVTVYGTVPRGFVMRNNIVGIGSYGVYGPFDPKGEMARAMFSMNVFVNLNGVNEGDYSMPPGNLVVNDMREVGFADAANGDYRLLPASKFYGKAGSDIASPILGER